MDTTALRSLCLANGDPFIDLAVRLGHLRQHPHEPPQEHILALLQPLLDVIVGAHIRSEDSNQLSF